MKANTRITSPTGRAIIRWAIGVVIFATLLTDRFAGRFFVPEEFAQRSTRDIQSSMRQSSLWRPRGPQDLPPSKRDDEIVIGIFGGSVAKGLAASGELVTAPAARDYSGAAGKRLRIVDFALGGAREPQQYNALHMFHDAIDVAVFLDGFNEMMQGEAEACDRLVPFWAENRKSTLELLQPLVELNHHLTALADSSMWNYLSSSWFFKIYLFRLSSGALVKTEDFARSMGVQSSAGNTFVTESERVKAWTHCLELSAEYAGSVNLPIFFFLQPNQHDAGSKPFSEEETLHAFPHPGKLEAMFAQFASIRDLTQTYTMFEEQIEQLRQRGIHAYSLSQIYNDVPETVYIDDCCHVNGMGNATMAQAIFLRMLRQE